MNKKGFTIIELLVVIAVFSVLIYVLTAMLINIAIAPKAEQSAIEQIDQARAVSNNFINEIRSAISCAGQASPISEAGDFQVVFCIDSKRGDENPQLDIDKIRYYKTGDTLYKGVTSPTFTGSGYVYTSAEKITTVLAGLVSNAEVATPTFYYYDGAYDGATGNPMPQSNRNMASIQFVRINLPVIKQKINPSTGVSLTGWSHRKQITILNTNIDADLTDFPLYVKIANDSLIGAVAKSDGSDIRFTSGDGVTLLQFEKESWTGGAETPVTANFWVKTPVYHTPTATQNIIYIYYGNAEAEDGQDATAVWDANFEGVWHLGNPTTLDISDSTSNANDGTNVGATATTGRINGGANFDGNSHYIVTTPTIGTSASFSMWATWTGAGNPMLFALASGSPGPDAFFYSGKISWNTYDSAGNPFGNIPSSANNGNFHYYTFIIESGDTKLYYDGILLGSAIYKNPTSNVFQIGGQSSYPWIGKIDEVHISSVARSTSWIKFEYYNMNDANADLTIPLTDETLQSGNFLEYSTENSFTITGGATIRSLRSANSFGQ